MSDVVVIGAGPAGMLAAIRAASTGNTVTLVEKNDSMGKKLLLSGKGRCNLTNICDIRDFLQRFSGNSDFLRDAFNVFFNTELISFFKEQGVRLKTERQNRVFPVSDSSTTVLNALKRALKANKVNILLNRRVRSIEAEKSRVKAVILDNKKFLSAEKAVLATGGATYSFTGSSGDGYNIAKALGHSVTAIKPGLVPLKAEQPYVKRLEGLSLRNIQLKFFGKKKSLRSGIGELLFTSSGVSGPLVLTLSGRALDILEDEGKLILEIDLKPGLTREKLDLRFRREIKNYPKKGIRNILKSLLPSRMTGVFIDITGIDPDRKASQITRNDRARLLGLFKAMRFDITGPTNPDKGMVTRGGVPLKEIDPKTMESRLVKGLYFAGEIIDIDADTGGFNLQAAFSTGYLAGS